MEKGPVNFKTQQKNSNVRHSCPSQLADGLTSNDFNTIRKVIYRNRRRVLPVLLSNIIEAHVALN